MKHMKKIVHIDEMKFEDFLNFVKDFNKNYNIYEISEKIDGQNFSFGFENNEFYTKTKRSYKITNLHFYEGVKFREGFLDFHKKINAVQFKYFCDYINELCFGFTDEEILNIQFFIELLPFKQTNNIIYSKEKCAILLDILVNDKSIINCFSNVDISLICMKLEKLIPGWTFYKKNIYHFNYLELNHIKIFEKIYEKNKNILISRKNIHKLEKKKVKKILKHLQMNIKNQLLKKINNSKSLLNAENIEGVVIMKDDINVKVVNKNEFSKENEIAQGINREIGQVSKQLNNMLKNLFNNHDLLSNDEKLFEKIDDGLLIKKAFDKKMNFFTYEEIIQLIIDDIKSENNFEFESYDDLLTQVLDFFEEINKNINELYQKWYHTIRNNQNDIHKEITQENFKILFERINNLKKCEFLNYDESISLLIKTLIPKSLKEEIMQRYIWE